MLCNSHQTFIASGDFNVQISSDGSKEMGSVSVVSHSIVSKGIVAAKDRYHFFFFINSHSRETKLPLGLHAIKVVLEVNA